MPKAKQNEQILKFLQDNKDGITPLEAFEQFKIMRLGARIWDLKHKGYNIVSLREQSATGSRYARYQLQGV